MYVRSNVIHRYRCAGQIRYDLPARRASLSAAAPPVAVLAAKQTLLFQLFICALAWRCIKINEGRSKQK